MCGSIIGALTASLQADIRARRKTLTLYILVYNAGRLLSYAAAGALLGFAGSTLSGAFDSDTAHRVLRWLATLFMLGMGLYLAGWFPAFGRLQAIGKPVWHYLEPLGKKLLPVSSLPQALILGIIWGWLPCGLVYAAAIYSTSLHSTGDSALFMTAFGLGTIPATVATGIFAGRILHLTRRPGLRRAAGIMIMLLSAASLLLHNDSEHSQHFPQLHQHTLHP